MNDKYEARKGEGKARCWHWPTLFEKHEGPPGDRQIAIKSTFAFTEEGVGI